MRKLIFFLQVSMKACDKCFDGDGQAFPSSQKSKFVMYLQYLKKEVTDEADFLR